MQAKDSLLRYYELKVCLQWNHLFFIYQRKNGFARN